MIIPNDIFFNKEFLLDSDIRIFSPQFNIKFGGEIHKSKKKRRKNRKKVTLKLNEKISKKRDNKKKF